MLLVGTERRILKWLCSILTEAQHTNNQGEDDDDAASDFDFESVLSDHRSLANLLRRVGISVVKVFAQMFEQCNSGWPIMTIIGESLSRYAALLETELHQ